MTPESRKTDVLAQTVGDELVIYDEQTHEAHHLSRTAAVVWRLADGQRSAAAIAAELRAPGSAIGPISADLGETASEEIVAHALDELGRAGLLVRPFASLGEPMSRREMIGVTAALVPVVLSIVAPSPAMAQSVPITPLPGAFNFAPFNGTYTGNGAPGELNGCGLGARPITIALSINGTGPTAGVGTMTITHQGAAPFNVVPAVATVLSATSVRVQGNAPTPFTSLNNVVFTLNTPSGAAASGSQQISSTSPVCNSIYNLNASKP